MKQTFEKYLKDVHCFTYTGTDDNMPDDFDNWLSQLDGEEYIKYAERYGDQQFIAGKQVVLTAIEKFN